MNPREESRENPSAETGSGISLAIGHHDIQGPNTQLALGLAVLVGLAVFVFIWRIRKTFGMKA